jgi:serine/threonine protein kinase/Flp pilus assembly protein TadD
MPFVPLNPDSQRVTGPDTDRGADDLPENLLGSLVAEMARAWNAGERLLVEDVLLRHPELQEDPEAIAELLYEEVSLRERQGERVSLSALRRRFPQWQGPLEMMLECRRLFEPTAAPRFPDVGAMHGEYQLRAELGRGRSGVVFLATQPQLADRPVVLKITPCDGQEHLQLARLQHTHIVPLYTAHDDAEQRLRSLCMPYFGGASLARILAFLKDRPVHQRRGADLLEAVDHLQADRALPGPMRGPARQLLERASYAQAVCWIGSCLADALHYAHQRGLVHLDLKPANVLLTGEGQPMLLDFHLAREPLVAGSVAHDGLGGTPDYMSPEQVRALAAAACGKPVPAAVNDSSDIFSLGIVLYEALADALPPPTGATARLRNANPGVSAGLAAILARCLAAEPGARYPDAAAVAADCQRHLNNLPLRGVPNRSLAERWSKWRRRRPYLFPFILLLSMVVLGGGAGFIAYCRSHIEAGRAALDEGQRYCQHGRYEEAVAVLDRGLGQLEYVPSHDELKTLLGSQRDQALQLRDAGERTRVLAELHQLADRLRWLCWGDTLPAAAQHRLASSCRSLWERRQSILTRLDRADPDQIAAVKQELLDVALVWTGLRVTLAREEEKNAARRSALQVLAEAEELCGPSPALFSYRERFAAGAGMEELARDARRSGAALTPRTAWEHVAVGRALLDAGHLRPALGHFEQAQVLQPENVWPYFYQALCACRLEDYEEAVIAFSVCIGFAPEQAVCFYNRGCACAALGRPERARGDFDRALRLEPNLAAALLARGRLHYQQKRYPDARADLQRALEEGIAPAVVYYDLALLQVAQGDRSAALVSIREVLRHEPGNSAALKLEADLAPMR